MLPAAFQPFVADAPFCVMARATLESLFSAERLDELFRTTAQRQYTRELLFSQLVELMTAVVLQQQPSVLAAYTKGIGGITVSDQSVYNKLDGMELGVSAALVRDSAQRVAPVIAELKARLPSWLPGYRVRILDGNHLSATERRLLPLRDAWDGPLPGAVLAVLDQQTGLATDVFLTPDGHAQERSLLDDVLTAVARHDLWIADRNFCTLKFLFRIHKARAAFAIRQHGQVVGRLLGKRRYAGRTDGGRNRVEDGFVRDFPHDELIQKLIVSADGKRLYTADGSGTLYVWDLEGSMPETPTPLTPKGDRFIGQEGLINAISLSADGARVVTGREDGTVRVWDAQTGTNLRTFRRPGPHPIRAVALDLRGTTAFATDRSGYHMIIDVDREGGRWAPSYPGGKSEPAEGRGVPHPDAKGQHPVYRGHAGEQDTGGGRRQRQHPLRRCVVRKGDGVSRGPQGQRAVLALAYSATRLVTGGANGAISVRPLKPGLKPIKLPRHTEAVHAVAITSDGRHVFSAGKDKTVRVWSVAKAAEVKRFTEHQEAVNGLALNPKTGKLLSVGDGVREWEVPADVVPKR